MKINFTNHTKEDVKEYQKIIRSVFKKVNDKHEMNIIFVDDEEIHAINRQYRDVDRVTDVISFALCDGEILMETDELGDVFICLGQAQRQAVEYEHSIAREMGFLAVHGYLHLCGYDHMNEEDEKKMFKRQDEILEIANLRR